MRACVCVCGVLWSICASCIFLSSVALNSGNRDFFPCMFVSLNSFVSICCACIPSYMYFGRCAFVYFLRALAREKNCLCALYLCSCDFVCARMDESTSLQAMITKVENMRVWSSFVWFLCVSELILVLCRSHQDSLGESLIKKCGHHGSNWWPQGKVGSSCRELWGRNGSCSLSRGDFMNFWKSLDGREADWEVLVKWSGVVVGTLLFFRVEQDFNAGGWWRYTRTYLFSVQMIRIVDTACFRNEMQIYVDGGDDRN